MQRLRLWWQIRTGVDDTPFDGDTPAWLVSLIFHVILLLCVGIASLTHPEYEPTLTLTAPLRIEEAPLQPDEFQFSDEPADEVGAGGEYGSDLAASLAPEISDISELPTPDLPQFEVGPLEIQDSVEIATGKILTQSVAIKGTVGAVTKGAAGAIDRLTQEILLSLENNKTLVVWVFDQSGSLQRQRREVSDRLKRIYRELGQIQDSGNKSFVKYQDAPLLSSVVAFGEHVTLVTPKPTADVDVIKSAVDSIPNDESGVENVFQAVAMAAEQYKRLRTTRSEGQPLRNVMLIVFTDEAGNDQPNLDDTVTLCRRYAIPVYVVGVPAPFGRQQTLVKYVDPDPNFDQTPRFLPVDQGPESLYPERLKLTLGVQDAALDSGFGPFGLTRLAFETGGIFFAVHPNHRTGHRVGRGEIAEFSSYMQYFFDPEVMHSYRPDYVSITEYQRRLSGSPMRQALIKASSQSRLEPMTRPQRRFVRRTEAALANALTEAQKAAAKLEPRVNSIYETLRVGEKDRDSENVPRWQAGYDLALGRILATKVRTDSYNSMLAMAKRGMKFKNEKNNTWVLKGSNEITAGSQLINLGEKARVYLERVIEEHPGTPWALLARRELETPLSWKWSESFTNLDPPRRRNNNNNPRPRPRDNQPRRLPKPKPKRPAPKL